MWVEQYQSLIFLYRFILLHFSAECTCISHWGWQQVNGLWWLRMGFPQFVPLQMAVGPGLLSTSPAISRLRGSNAGFLPPPAKNTVLWCGWFVW